MLFLGTLDDKTLEYPYGNISSDNSVSLKRAIFHHTLFGTEPIVLEEGFILASDEAINLGPNSNFIVSAIQSGHVKVASRHRDMHRYVVERRQNKHLAPPDTVDGRAYVDLLQRSCDNADAFINYPESNIDEITFNRFCQIADMDNTNEILNFGRSDIPKDFIEKYTKAYETGNDGKRWTARSAWEHTIKDIYRDREEVVHSLMVMANRERQIIRAVGISHANNTKVNVETGFDKSHHDLASSIGLKGNVNFDNNSLNIYPRVGVDSLYKNRNKFFKEISNSDSVLSSYRNVYVTLLNRFDGSETSGVDLERVALDYEREIYNAIQDKPLEKYTSLNTVGTAISGTAIGAAISALWGKITKEQERALFSDDLKVDLSRRRFLKRASCLSVLTVAYLADNQAGSKISEGTRYVRSNTTEDIGDEFIKHINISGAYHQILGVNPESSRILGL